MFTSTDIDRLVQAWTISYLDPTLQTSASAETPVKRYGGMSGKALTLFLKTC